jgi:hypothetical protein
LDAPLSGIFIQNRGDIGNSKGTSGRKSFHILNNIINIYPEIGITSEPD